jgi:hypothetical protein
MTITQSIPSTKKAKPRTDADLYAEYCDVIRPPSPPRAHIKNIELLSQTIAIRIWAFRTTYDLATVLRPDFFRDLRDVHLKKNDRLEVIASWDEDEAEHATLCVDRVSGTGLATVSLICRYQRAA